MPPAAAAGSSEAVSSEAESLLPLVSQPVSPTAASGAAHSSSSAGHRTSSGCPALRAQDVYSLISSPRLVFRLISLRRNFSGRPLSFRNFHLWFANMGSSCGFSRGNVVMLLLLLDGKVHLHLYYLSHDEEVGNSFLFKYVLHGFWCFANNNILTI